MKKVNQGAQKFQKLVENYELSEAAVVRSFVFSSSFSFCFLFVSCVSCDTVAQLTSSSSSSSSSSSLSFLTQKRKKEKTASPHHNISCFVYIIDIVYSSSHNECSSRKTIQNLKYGVTN
jgi:hypothetical protein